VGESELTDLGTFICDECFDAADAEAAKQPHPTGSA